MTISANTVLRACAWAIGISGILGGSASAGFDSWSTEVASDPFKGGDQVSVDYMQTVRSGAFVLCNTDTPGIVLRTIPGWAYVPALEGFEPKMAVAIDGAVILEMDGSTGSVGDNLAMAEAHLNPEQSAKFIKAFGASKKQIAIKDGISDAPMLLKARGSTKAGQRLERCLAVNASNAMQTAPSEDCNEVFDETLASSKASTATGKAMEAADAVRECKASQ